MNCRRRETRRLVQTMASLPTVFAARSRRRRASACRAARAARRTHTALASSSSETAWRAHCRSSLRLMPAKVMVVMLMVTLVLVLVVVVVVMTFASPKSRVALRRSCRASRACRARLQRCSMRTLKISKKTVRLDSRTCACVEELKALASVARLERARLFWQAGFIKCPVVPHYSMPLDEKRPTKHHSHAGPAEYVSIVPLL
mmetsp:Transcript_13338/g.25924  ORF Transcript_13338/g.25924 Transcript_13338/m.25924 type:complete len:202 (-) Transcript_13338:100-705(-)